ncbi:hypothetical protein [Pseudomonas oryzicola]|uniref:Uncharacterized protein n=1 Tax=Pseudomonas oryzicola TaxID=485876 RepID=A0ABS6QEY9_9PSED|nr:hypothetical protein [Pseudomonas oryzicola]MBV4492756.1 hypothetical protein [Pseudomonas oryzicola]
MEKSAATGQLEKRPVKLEIPAKKFAKAAKKASVKHRRLYRAFALKGHGGASAQGLQQKLSALSRSTVKVFSHFTSP